MPSAGGVTVGRSNAGGLAFRPRHTDRGGLVPGSLARRDAGGSDVDGSQAGSAALR